MRILAATLLLSALAGCATGPAAYRPSKAPPPVNLSGFPAAYKQGHADGCASAKPLSLTRKDEARFKSDSQYAQGWRDGLALCKRR